MKKSKLIKMLSELKGDPDIILWNGMVGDWMDISPKLVEGDLVKQTLPYYLRSIENEEKVRNKNFDFVMTDEEKKSASNYHKNKIDWEQNNFVTQEDIREGRYKVKTVFYIDAKSRGVDTFDRLGSISY